MYHRLLNNINIKMYDKLKSRYLNGTGSFNKYLSYTLAFVLPLDIGVIEFPFGISVQKIIE